MAPLPAIRRDEFLASLGRALASAERGSDNLGLLLIDISNLGAINRRLGFDAGDGLLRGVSSQLLSVSKLPDTVYRIGSHGFAFILPQLQNPGFIALAVNRVQRLLEDGLDIDDAVLSADVNIGLGLGRPGNYAPGAVLAQAEASLAQVKLGGNLAIEELLREQPGLSQDLELEQRFAEALYDNALELHYQPKISLHSGRVEGAEALLRWELAGHGAITPDRVVRMAEESGRVYDLSKWVLNRALRQLRQWQRRFDLPLSVNVPASMVNHPDLANMVHDALNIWGVDPAMLTLEITEDAVIEDKEAGFHVLRELCEQGVRLSIDDFGTGYSSLSYFQHIPATELKIDKSFVRRMMAQRREEELVRIIIEIAHLFDFKVVAEGVEDEATRDRLAVLGCDCVQGFLYAPALNEEAFLAWVGERI